MATLLAEHAGNRDNNFNLLRLVAATLVLVSHSFALVSGTADAEPLKGLVGMTWGSIAVDLFFVTSGFLIAGSFFGRNTLLAFTVSRILRIYPALMVSTLFCIFIVGLVFTTSPGQQYLTDLQVYKYLGRNSTLIFGVEYQLPGVFEKNPYQFAVNGSLWTLPHEVRMYAYLAIGGSLLLWFQRRRQTSVMGRQASVIESTALGIAGLAVTAVLLNHFIFEVPANSLRLFTMFFTGCAYFVSRDRITLSPQAGALAGVALLLAGSFNKDLFFVLYIMLLPYLVFCLAYLPTGRIRSFNRAGDYSYGVYIYAFPVQQAIVATIPTVSVTGMVALSSLITFALAFLSWHLVEKKALAMKGLITHARLPFKSARAWPPAG